MEPAPSISPPDLDLDHQRTLFVVATVHLDTQWRWTIQDTIRRFLPATLAGNFALFERFPRYVLSFEGAFRYMLIQEYYPGEFARLQEWARQGRWQPAGSMLDAADVNLPSPESLCRQILYATRFFRRELGRPSRDLFLPDGFGFGHALPSVAAHCGLRGFSSQKFIKWMAPAEIPFDLGVWEGPDGGGVVAALNPDGYGDGIDEDLTTAPRWIESTDRLGHTSGVYLGYKYFGTGDRGGAPDDRSVELLEESLDREGPIRVVHSASDRPFELLDEAQRRRLPRFRGELLLPTHGTGCWTSQAALKRWNRKNELLAEAAEKAAVVADWLGAMPYPAAALREGWLRFLWHQMHDDITGTSIPAAYRFSWNDEAFSLNRFSTVLTDAVGAVARGLETRVEGRPLVVFNPLALERQDVVEGWVDVDGPPPPAIRVLDPDGRETPAQVVDRRQGAVRIAFLARVPSLSFSTFEVRPAETPGQGPTELAVDVSGLENHRYRVRLDAQGDLESVWDKLYERELLDAAAGLRLLPDRSYRWPAWEILPEDLARPALPLAARQMEVRVVEQGPARVALEVTRRTVSSQFTQRLSLAAGDAGQVLEIDTRINWRTSGRLLKASFPLAIDEPVATYDLGLGTIERGVNRPERHEVPAQQWADLSTGDGSFGVSILNDSRYGWDRPTAATLRLSLLRSPRAWRKFRHQRWQDFGRHRVLYALAAHGGDWRQGQTVARAARLNQPLLAFAVASHPGPLGRRYEFLQVSEEGVAVRALKQAEEGDGIVVRLQETLGQELERVELATAASVTSAREVNGAEEEPGAECSADGRLVTGMRAYAPRTFAVRLAPPTTALKPTESTPLELPFDVESTSFHGSPPTGDFDGRGRTFPGELLLPRIDSGGTVFELGPLQPGAANAMTCRGQILNLPRPGGRLHLLAAAVRRTTAWLMLGAETAPLEVPRWTGLIGHWGPRSAPWRRRWAPDVTSLERRPVAWLASHRHDRRLRDEPYVFCYLFRFSCPLPSGCSEVRLPGDPAIRIFAATLTDGADEPAVPADCLYD